MLAIGRNQGIRQSFKVGGRGVDILTDMFSVVQVATFMFETAIAHISKYSLFFFLFHFNSMDVDDSVSLSRSMFNFNLIKFIITL